MRNTAGLTVFVKRLMIKRTISAFVRVNLFQNVLKSIVVSGNLCKPPNLHSVHGLLRSPLRGVEKRIIMVDRTIKTPEMEVNCNDSYALHSQFEPPEEATYSSADNYSARNEQCSSGSSVHDAKTSACHRDLSAEIVDSKSVEFLSESGSFGLVSLFDESVALEDATTTRDTNRWRSSGRQNEKRKQVESSGQESTQDWQPKKRPKKTRPNYFVAWKVSNPEIHSAIRLVQDSIIAHSEILKPALIPLDTLHITLMVMHLEDNEQVEKAKSALKNCKIGICSILKNAVGENMAECTEDKSVELQECCGEESMPVTSQESVPVALTFSGLDQFRHQVIFAKLGTEEDMALLNSVASVVREEFNSEGIFSTDSHEFQPHLTVMKLSRKPLLKKKGVKTIPAESYSAFQDTEFGRQSLTQLHLCSMIHPKENGFYKTFGTVELGDDAKNDVNTNDEGTSDENEPQV